jgi:PAS domain S-box-containing protein
MDNRKAKILLVDDTPEDLIFVCDFLEVYGYETQSLMSGELVLDAVANFQPEIIILDLIMPEVDGYEVCQKLKSNEETAAIPVIFLTAMNQTDEKVKAFKLGAADYISKPFQPEEILIRVENQLKIYKLQKQLEEQNVRLQQKNQEKEQLVLQLSQRNQYIESIINAIPVGIAITDENGYIKDINKAYCQLHGMSKEEIIGNIFCLDYQNLTELERESTIQKYQGLIRKGKEYKEGEEKLIAANGSLLNVEINHIYFHENNQKNIISIIHNITEQKLIETANINFIKKISQHQLMLTALSQKQDLYQGNLKAFFQAITKAAAQNLDIERASIWLYGETRSFIECLDLYEESKNHHSQGYELLAVDYPDYFNSLNEDQLIIIDNIAVDYRTQSLLDSYFNPLGIVSIMDIPLRIRGQVVGVLCLETVEETNRWTIEDQNFAGALANLVILALEARERQRADIAHQRSEKKLASAFKSSPDPIALVSFPNGHYIEVNDSFCKLFGYSQTQIVGKSQKELGIWLNNQECQELVVNLQFKRAIRNQEIDFITATGEIKTTLLSAEILEIDRQQYVLATAKDITERQQAEQEISLLLSTTKAIAEAVDVESALSVVLRLICTTINWDFAEAWAPNHTANLLECSNSWYAKDKNLEGLSHSSENITFSLGNGLLGRVWQQQKPEWIEDISIVSDPIFINSKRVSNFGLKAAFAVPILIEENVLAVLVFFKRSKVSVGLRLIELVGTVAAQLGGLIQRKQIEAAHRQSEERLQLALEASDLGLWDWNILSGEIYRDWRWKLMLGYEADELDDSMPAFQELVHPEDRQMVKIALDEYLGGVNDVYHAEFRMGSKSGEWIWIQSRGRIVERNQNGKPVRITGTHKDITKKKYAEQELKESECRFRAIFNCSFQFVAILQTNGTVIDINQTAIDFFGHGQDLIGLPLWECPYWGNLLENQNLCRETINLVATGEFVRYEVDILTINNTSITIDFSLKPVFNDNGEVVLLIAEGRDITSRKVLEKELALREARLNAFFNGAPVGLNILDNQLRVIKINGLLAEINGYSIEEHIGRTIDEVLPDITANATLICQQVLSTGESILNVELWVNSNIYPHNIHHFLVSYFPIFEEDNTVSGVGSVLVEVTQLKQIQLELNLAKQRLQYLLKSSPAVIFSCYPYGNFSNTFISDNIKDIMGYDAQDFLIDGDFWCSHIHPEDRERVFHELSKVLENLFGSYEYRFLHRDGTYHWFYEQVRLINDEEDNPIEIIGYWVDITERKQTELALAESQNRYQMLADFSPVCIFHSTVDGHCLYMNKRWTEMTGYDVTESLGKNWRNILHPDDREKVIRGRHGLEHKSEHRMIRNDGKEIWVICQSIAELGEYGEVKGYIGTIVDITEIKQAEVALRESAIREKAISEIIQRMRQTLDIDEIFTATTQELRQVLNCDRVVVYQFNADWSGEFVAESLAGGWVSLIEEHQNDPLFTVGALESDCCIVKNITSNNHQVLDTYLQETQGGVYSRGRSYICVSDIYSQGFAPCYIELLERFQAKAYITVPIFCGNKLWGLLGSYDNSGPREWKKSEINIAVQIGNQLGVGLQQAELLAKTKKQSQALQKALLAADAANLAKSEFLANMSHELRTPLNAILGFTQLMNRDKSLSPEHLENLMIINRAGEHLLNLINDILEISKIEAGRTNLNIINFDLIRLLDTLEELFKFRAVGKGLELIIEYASDIPQYIKTDESKLKQVLLNILGNAIKFTSTGNVTLQVTNKQGEIENKNRENTLKESNPAENNLHFLTFSVSDTGPGIAAEEIKLLFEPFAQTETGRKSQQGTGLGLAICQKYVQLMGGNILANSIQGLGSTFTINIPVTIGSPDAIQISQTLRQVISLAPNQAEFRILVVDDNIDSRLLAIKILESVGFAVREAVNGEDGIAIWESWHPHLILMDMRMPIIDGCQATQIIRSKQGEIASTTPPIIIALTANAFEKQKQIMLNAGCEDFIKKPFREDLILQKIARYLGVEYIYQDSNDLLVNQNPNNTFKNFRQEDISSLLLNMSPELIRQLNLAAAQGSDDLILELLEQIPLEYTVVKDYLKDLANNFQFETIMQLISG